MTATAITLNGALIGNASVGEPPAPARVSDPVIDGTTAYSGSLTIDTDAVFRGPVTSTGHVWQRDGEDTDQTGSTYVKSASDAGTDIRLRAYADGPGGSVFAYSDPISIAGALAIGFTTFPEGQAGTLYSYTIPASGGVEPYTFAASGLPTGLSINSVSGEVSGTPTTLGDFSFTASVTDSSSPAAVSSTAGTFTISTTPIGAISDLAQVSITTTTVTVSFTNASNATSHQYRLNGGTWTSLGTDKIITGLTAGTGYTVEVRGISNYANGADSNDLSITTTSSDSPTVGLGYTPSYVPAWTLKATRALLLTDLGLTTGDVITASDYASMELALDAANAAQKPLVVGTDNGQYTKTTTRSRVYCDVPIYGYGTSPAQITGASRLEGWLCIKRNNVKIYGVEGTNFTQFWIYAPGTLPQTRPDKSGYNAATTPAARSPYHTSNDKATIANLTTVDAGFMMQCVGHFSVSGSPNISSITPLRFRADGGPGGTRTDYNYAHSGDNGRQYYSPSHPNGVANLMAAMDASPPNLLASTVNSATNASLITAINANTATSGYAAQLDPSTNKVVIYVTSPWIGTASISNGSSTLTISTTSGTLAVGMTVGIQTSSTNFACVIQSGSGSTWTIKGTSNVTISGGASAQPAGRPLDWTVTKTGGTVTYDAVGPDVDTSYSTFPGCDRIGGGIGDTTAIGKISLFKNDLDYTWGGVSFNCLQWTEVWVANNDWQNCLLSQDGSAWGRSSGGNAQNRASNQDGTFLFMGSNNQALMYFVQQRGGMISHVENNYGKNIEGNINVDTVNSATFLDLRGIWDSSANGKDNNVWEYNYFENVRNVVGAIDCNLFYTKTDSCRCRYNVAIGFGAKRVSGYRPNIGAGSEAGFFLAKNNGYDFDTTGEVDCSFNFLADGPNGIPHIKGEDKGGAVNFKNNHLKNWDIRLDDATVGDARGRTDPATNGTCTVATTGAGTSGNPYVVTMTATVANGTLRPGMAVVIGSNVRYVVSGSGGTWILNNTPLTVSSSTAWSADWLNRVDGALIRWYSRIGNFSLTSNFFENINDMGQVVVLLHSISNSGGSYAGWAIHNNVCQNDNSSAYPQHTGTENWFYLDNSPSGMGSVSNIVLGRNKAKNAAGTEVGNITFRQGSTYYSDNGNSSSDPYVPVP